MQTETLEPRVQTVAKTYREVLSSLSGKVVTIVNPESYEEGPVCNRLTTSFYRAKVLALSDDFVKLQTVYRKHGAKSETEHEPVVQYVPIDRVKRVSVMRTDTILHL